MRTKLPTALFLAGIGLLCPACTQTSAEAAPAHPHRHDYRPEFATKRAAKEQQLANIRQAARDCASMEWYASISTGASKSYRIGKADAGIIRDMMLHKLHIVKFGHPKGLIVDPAWPLASISLRFLDANGGVISEFEFYGFNTGIGKDSDTDKNGYQYHRDFSLPDADYKTWCKLIPARIKDDIAQWRKEYHNN